MEINTKNLEPIIIRSILEAPALMKTARVKLEYGDFENEFCGRIFQVMVAIEKRREKITMKTVEAFLDEDDADLLEGFLESSEYEDDSEIFAQYVSFLHQEATRDATIQILEDTMSEIEDDQSYTLESITERINKARSAINEKRSRGSARVHNAQQIVERFQKKMETIANIEGDIVGMSSGFHEIDIEINGIEAGKYICIAGRPGMGKTTLAVNIMVAICQKGGRSVFFSQEMLTEELTMRMAATVARVEFDNIRKGKMSKDEAIRVKHAIEQILDWDIHICDEAGITYDLFESVVTELVEEGKLDFVGVDYLQLFSLKGLEGTSQTEKLESLSKQLKALANNLGVPIIVLSQLNRELEKRPDKRPINSDLKSTGAIEQDADIILFCYRDEMYDPDTRDKGIAEIICSKNRGGRNFVIKVLFEGQYYQFREIPKDEESEQEENDYEIVV